MDNDEEFDEEFDEDLDVNNQDEVRKKKKKLRTQLDDLVTSKKNIAS